VLLAAHAVTIDHEPDRKLPLGAKVLAASLLVTGVARVFDLGLRLLLDVMPPLVSRRLDADVRSSVIWVGTVLCLWLLLAAVSVAGALALFFRGAWARPWLVAASLGLLVPLAGDPLGAFQGLVDAAHNAFLPPLAWMAMVAPVLLAPVALGALAVRGRRWLPPASRGQWTAAALAVTLLVGSSAGIVASQDPGRRARQFEEEVAALTVEPGAGRLVIVPTHDGHPLDANLEAPVRLTLDELKTKSHREISARCAHGAIEVTDVPTGVYGMSFGIDANPANGWGSGWGMPGDFISWGEGRWDLVRSGQEVRQEVPVYRIVRLLQPQDSASGLPQATGSPPAFDSPVTFEWEPVPGARTYGFHVSRTGPNGDQRIDGTQKPITRWAIDLQPSAPDEYYRFEVTASGETGQIGIFEVQGNGWRGRDYRFRVNPPSSAGLSKGLPR